MGSKLLGIERLPGDQDVEILSLTVDPAGVHPRDIWEPFTFDPPANISIVNVPIHAFVNDLRHKFGNIPKHRLKTK